MEKILSCIRWWPALLISFGSWWSAYAASDLRPQVEILKEWKYPNSADEGLEPVETSVMVLKSGSRSSSAFSSMLPYVTRSPYQDEAGSCLYMSLTGIAEWWLRKLSPKTPYRFNGELDLSERHLMNLAGLKEEQNGELNWKTDSIFLFNRQGQGVRNSHYPFTKGWYETNDYGEMVAVDRKTDNAKYGTSYNWIDQLEKIKGGEISLPHFERDVLFADPESNQWNTGVAPLDIVDQVKNALKKNQAPVLVIYNHYGYWHANFIVGYDDKQEHTCSFVTDFFPYMQREAEKYQQKARVAKTESERKKWLSIGEKYSNNGARAENRFLQQGGCSKRGVFYVRDSLYPDKNSRKYDYDSSGKGEEEYYVKKTVLREYEWLRDLSNHVTQISVHSQLPKDFSGGSLSTSMR